MPHFALIEEERERERLDESLHAAAAVTSDHIAALYWLDRSKGEKEIEVCGQIIDAISSYANFFGRQLLHKSRRICSSSSSSSSSSSWWW